MKKRIKKKWLEALRSGDYKQTTGALRIKTDDGFTYCCLGVLEQIRCDDVEGKRFPANCSVLTKSTVEWAGLSESDPELGDYSAVDCNDGTFNLKSKTFKQIADRIEKYL